MTAEKFAAEIRSLGITVISGPPVDPSAPLAKHLEELGYRKRRTITTAEELDTLPEGTSILDQAEKLTLEETSMECLEWVDRHGNACHVELPAIILEAQP